MAATQLFRAQPSQLEHQSPALTVSASPTTVTAGTPTNVKFTVKNQSSGLVVSGATVTLTGVATGSGTSGADGIATISVNAGSGGTITATASKTGYTSGTTTVTSISPADSITVTSPNGGESWLRGSVHPITWTSIGSVGSTVKIELLKAEAVIASSTQPNTGTFQLDHFNLTSNRDQLPDSDYQYNQLRQSLTRATVISILLHPQSLHPSQFLHRMVENPGSVGPITQSLGHPPEL